MKGISKPIILVCLTAAANCATIGYDYSMLGALNILDRFTDKFNVTPDVRGLFTAIQNVGSIAGSFVAGILVDRYGRKGGILISSCVALLACIILSTTQTRAQFFVGRILVGVSKAIDIAAVPTYLVEIAPPRFRGLVAGFYWTCWLLGAILASAVGYGARSIGGDMSWRAICIVMAGPALSCILLLFFIPESPRWLMSRDRQQEALEILAKYHGDGDSSDPLVVAQFREIKETLAMEQANQYSSWASWWRDFNSKANRHRAFVLISLGVFEQTVGSSIITFYLSSVLNLAGVTSEKEQFAINLGQNCVAFASAIGGIVVLDKVGRIPMMIFGSCFCAAVLACMAGLTADQIDNQSGRYGVIAMVFLFQFGYSSTWTPISFSYCAEILNFTIRAKGMA
jgi:sugar porter (SP) family MFS transporter